MNLRLFLSDRCNMACDYCFLALNRGPAVVLDEKLACAAVRRHLERYGRSARFSILGGEPLIHPGLIRAILAEIKRRAPVSITTNGTRACSEILKEFSDAGAQIALSLDGAAETHDAHRRLLGSKGSSHAEILRALESGAAPLRVNMVVRADTAPSLLRNVEFLRARGFRRISFHLDVLERWTPRSLETLSAALEGFARYFRALPAGALELTHRGSFQRLATDHDDDDVILGADGRYYPCDGLFARPYAALDRWACAEPEAAEKLRAEARREIHGILGGALHYSCPREPYFYAVATGGDRRDALLRFHRADELFGVALNCLAREEAVHGR